MGKLDEQIKLLQRKKAKTDLFNRIVLNLEKELPQAEKEMPDHPGLMGEVVLAVKTFCLQQINEIVEEDAPPAPRKVRAVPPVSNEDDEEDEPVLTVDDIDLTEPPKGAPRKKKAIVISKDHIYGDALKFVTHFKEFVGKQVSFVDGTGNKLQGELVGAQFPNLKINLNGRVVIIDPKNVDI